VTASEPCARIALGGVAFIVGLLSSNFTAEAQSAMPPDVVKLPAGINLGSSSFYDGFGSTDPGWTSLNYLRWNVFTSIKDGTGHNSPLFVDPRINAISTLFHAVYVPPIAIPNGAIAFEALLPIVDFQSHFNAPGTVLQDNGLNFSDLTFGAAYQSKPISLGNQAVLSWRVDVDITAPTAIKTSTKAPVSGRFHRILRSRCCPFRNGRSARVSITSIIFQLLAAPIRRKSLTLCFATDRPDRPGGSILPAPTK
jgi:hypothetical protein